MTAPAPALVALPDWAALLVSALVLTGAAIALVGALGVARWRTFFRRAHATAVGATGGLLAICLGSALYFTVAEGRLSTHEALIALFVWTTTPISLSLLCRADVHRERIAREAASGNVEAP